MKNTKDKNESASTRVDELEKRIALPNLANHDTAVVVISCDGNVTGTMTLSPA